VSDRAWEADPDPFDELAALDAAATAPELWYELLLHEPRGSTTDPEDAMAALCRLHSAGEAGAPVTALLLLTASRWRRCTAPLLRRIAACELLADNDLDELAEVGLFDDEAGFVVPAEVFAGPSIVLTPADERGAAADERSDDAAVWPDDLPDTMMMTRTMQPPLRRWGAGHLLRRDPARLPDVRERIRELDPSAAAAAMCGVLDALDALPPEPVDRLLRDASRWPHKSVRLPALQLMAERGQRAEAVRRAQADPDAKIRAAAATLAGLPTETSATLF
jgi:hypothetical protein